MASEANPVLQDVEAQLHRIHCAVNDGTLDRAAVADALRLIHDFVSGAAYDDVAAEVEADEAPRSDEDERDMPHRKPRKKR